MAENVIPRILFVLKWREQPYGSGDWGDGGGYNAFLHSGLYNSAKMVNDMLVANGFESKLVHVQDNNAIHKEIVEYGATHVVVEAFWVVPEKFDELYRAVPNVKFIIRNHSECPFLANEGIAFDWMMKYLEKPNVIMSCNSERMLEETRFLAKVKFPTWSRKYIEKRIPYLPNYYPIFNDPGKFIRESSDFIDVGCFGSIRPLKNHVAQAIAAIKFAEEKGKILNFHVNGNRIEQGGSPIRKNLESIFTHAAPHTITFHPWVAHDEFKALVREMDVLMQVSFTETFNIVTADAVAQGVPVVTSNEVTWVNPLFHADPTDTDNIAKKLEVAYNLKAWWPKLNPSLTGLKKYNKRSVSIWGDYFTREKNFEL